MDTILHQQLKESGFIRRPMMAVEADSGLARWLKKPVEASRSIPLAENFSALRHTGHGIMYVDQGLTKSGNGSVVLDYPTSTAIKQKSNRAYAGTGVFCPIPRENLEA